MEEKKKIDEQYAQKIALKAFNDITQIVRIHKMPDSMIMDKGAMRDLLLAVYQAGAKTAMDEYNRIFLESIKINPNPDDVPF